MSGMWLNASIPIIRTLKRCEDTGNPQATFAIDSQIDTLAEMAGIDPLDFRLRNANAPERYTSEFFKITPADLRECIDAVAQKLDWRQSRGRQEEGDLGGFHDPCGGGARVYKSDGCGTIIRWTTRNSKRDHPAQPNGTGSGNRDHQIAAEGTGRKGRRFWSSPIRTRTSVPGMSEPRKPDNFVAGNSARGAAEK